jgi:cell division protein FtsL
MNQQKPAKFSLKLFLLDVFSGGQGYRTKNAEKKTPFPLVQVALFIIATALILSIIFSVIHISEISSEIASLKKQIISLTNKQSSLENDLDHRYSFAEIIEAVKELGFAEDGGKIVYIEPKTNTDTNSEE